MKKLILLVSLLLLLPFGFALADDGVSVRFICGDYDGKTDMPVTHWFSITSDQLVSWEQYSGDSLTDYGQSIGEALILGAGGTDVSLRVYLDGELVGSAVGGTTPCAGGQEFLDRILTDDPLPVNPVPVEPQWYCGHTSVDESTCEFTASDPIPDPAEFGCDVPLTITVETPLYWWPGEATDAVLQPGTTLGGGVMENGWFEVLWVGQRLYLPENVVMANGIVCVSQ